MNSGFKCRYVFWNHGDRADMTIEVIVIPLSLVFIELFGPGKLTCFIHAVPLGNRRPERLDERAGVKQRPVKVDEQ